MSQPAAPHAPRRPRWRFALQLAGTLLLSAVLLRSLDWSELRSALVGLNWNWVMLSGLLLSLAHLSNILRWQQLGGARAVGFGKLLSYYGAGLFSNNFLPSGIGGDGVRAALLARDLPLGQALLSVALDRLSGICSLALLLIPALWSGLPPGAALLLPRQTGQFLPIGLLLAGLLGIAGLSGWLLARRAAWFQRFQAQSRQRVQTITQGVRGGLRNLGLSLPLAIFAQLWTAAAYWAAAAAFGISIGPAAALWLLLAIGGSLLLPIAINGLGLQEGVAVALLLAYGASHPAALATALLLRLLGLLLSLLGGLAALRVSAMQRITGSAPRSPS